VSLISEDIGKFKDSEKLSLDALGTSALFLKLYKLPFGQNIA